MVFARWLLAFGALLSATAASDAQNKARVFSCEGSKIEPATANSSPIKIQMTLGPGTSVSLDGPGIAPGSRFVSDNKIQYRFVNKEFTGEYFHYTGDLFLVYQSKHLAKLACKPV